MDVIGDMAADAKDCWLEEWKDAEESVDEANERLED